MGTTRREASCGSGQRSSVLSCPGRPTMRELGNVFQLRRMPSRSSTSLHWSFNASKSAILCWCRECGQGRRVDGGTVGAHRWDWRGGEGGCEQTRGRRENM
jgi:hypothetical protein